MTETVGTVGEVAEVDESEEKTSGRQIFDVVAYGEENEGTVDSDGLLLAVPTTYNSRKNKPLKKEAFASEATYIRYQATVAEQRSDFYAAKAVELASKAMRIEKFGSEAARKTANKLAKAKAQMAKLRATLLETMDESELDAIFESM